MIHLVAGHSRVMLTAFITAASALLACGSTRAETPEELFKIAKDHDIKLEAKEALACYLEYVKVKPDDADALVGIARQYRHLMADSSSESEKMKYGAAAIE